ncbi:aminopeptidase P family protein [Amaricoccus solimangrovi]|uniref:Aminopeptidase P family protein n=1 Tax=Amaricoccus solimangrovi TaxID=2589815 RepID=A0A501WPY5_9RHOB|nr:aminopeptidase P family protein [Amaricoccus solimangrovi]TPE50174.1 aminopeptidase P family protein [Amaricoccus solimangrovi]
MLQDFRRRTMPETGAPRLAALRAAMAEAGVDAFLVPRADAHQGENVAPRDERLAWLTGFTGSAGAAAVARERAAVFVDGRYRLQVRDQVDTGVFETLRIPEDAVADWLVAAIPGGGRLGFDPWLHTRGEIDRLEETLGRHQIGLARVANLVDAVWPDQPPPPAEPIVPHPDRLAGRPSAEKRAELAAALAAKDLAAFVLTFPDSIAWLLNIRGSDIARTPVGLAFAILGADGRVSLFVDPAQVGPETRAHLGPEVSVAPREALGPALDALKGRVGLDKARAPVWIADRLAEGRAEIAWETDPCLLPKACKTEAELAGSRAAHLRDAAAMAEFLAWLDAEAPSGKLTETAVVRRLEEFRAATGQLRDISFETICGAGSDGAIVHYRVTEDSDRPVRPGELLLVDSGAQYPDGTTDITRTVAVGAPPEAAIRPFTLVLRGLIAVSRQNWPEGRTGRDIDVLARAALWNTGLDYDHGTGHGVGAYLGVHEGPQSLSSRGLEPLRAGMVVSVEPGYYREGAFGIRTENLVAVRPAATPEGGERAMLGFETLTLAPIDRRLIDPALLGPEERAWLDAYHARVLAEVGPAVTPETARWLAKACAPI